jgi:hypothetical protein
VPFLHQQQGGFIVFFFWIAKPRLFWSALTVVVGAPWLGFVIETEEGFRLIGLGLQLIGILTVAYNLRGTRRQFDRPSVLTRVVQWWRERPKFRYPPIIGSMSATLAPPTMKARAYVWDDSKPDATVDQRVSTLERNLNRTRDWLIHIENSIDENKKSTEISIKQEQITRAEADSSIEKKLEQSQIEGLHISLFGIVCLIIGSIMGAASVELLSIERYFRL